jgi:hypothetical protein
MLHEGKIQWRALIAADLAGFLGTNVIVGFFQFELLWKEVDDASVHFRGALRVYGVQNM